ncbi:alpha/beta hydrolase [Sphingobium phenoxybenzoativorans]|uniref:alpha/beta hydrolase n=1 Tax=Sphingobium phenoxybenzoativorans TaxID=1592790 RepID=UPI000871BC35|nr:alpha/beta hydrolase [Sphingobium phenoxybenzoativorans]
MSSRHLIETDLIATLEALPVIDFATVDLPPLRAAMDQMFADMPMPEGLPVSVERKSVPGENGAPDVGIMIYTPTAGEAPFPALLHIHGGGYVIGSAAMTEAANRARSAEMGCVIVSVDYRLAPETAHPGLIEDCYAALRYLHGNAGALNVDSKRIGVTGESAGGGLAAALAVMARDKGEFPIAFQHLIYPMLDDRTCTMAEPHPHCGEFIWTPDQNRFGWSAYLGHAPGAEAKPYAAAARSDDLSGLPPAFIAVGAIDLFMEENLEFARRLTRAGVPVELHVYPGAFHGFDMAADAAVSKAFKWNSDDALRRAMARR